MPAPRALGKAIDAGWIEGPRIVPAGHAITPTGGHLDPTMFAAFMPGALELTVEEGIANGVDEIRKAVRYQIKHGAQLKVCVSGGVMSLTGEAGARHYSDEELRAVVDEAHRRGMRVAAHTHGAEAVKHADELVTLVDWGMPPAAVLRAATVVAADLINVTDRGRLAEGQVEDVIAVPGDPLVSLTVTKQVSFVMKGSKVLPK